MATPKRRATLLQAACIVALVSCAGVTRTERPIPLDGGERITTWSARVPQGPGKGIYFQNLTDKPIQITTIILYGCSNVAGACESMRPDNLIVPAKETVLGLIVLPREPRAAFDFHWKFRWQYAPAAFVRTTS